jgi:hypothetical protein
MKITNRWVKLRHLARTDKFGIGSVLGVPSLVEVPLPTGNLVQPENHYNTQKLAGPLIGEIPIHTHGFNRPAHHEAPLAGKM